LSRPVRRRTGNVAYGSACRLCQFVIVMVIALLCACAGTGKKKDGDHDKSAEQLYEQGQKALASGDYQTAIERFETLEARFPFGPVAQKAQLDAIYAHYKQNDVDAAIAAADRFIKLYPRNERVDYAYYLRGLARFNEGFGTFEQLMSMDPVYRDPRAMRESFQYFADLIKRFPDSQYVADAKQRMVYLRNNLAHHEIYVARYYLRRHAYVAALNRAKYVIESLPQSNEIPAALEIMVTAYRALGLDDLASDTKRVLVLNYPGDGRNTPAPAAANSHAEKTEKINLVLPATLPASVPAPEPNPAPVNATLGARAKASVTAPAADTNTKPQGAAGSDQPDPAAAPDRETETAHEQEPGHTSTPAQALAALPIPAAPPQEPALQENESPANALDVHRQWLMRVDPENYTIQLLSADRESAVIDFMNDNRLENKTHYFYNVTDNGAWYSLVYGNYATRRAAQESLENLPAALRTAHPWIRTMGTVQELIRSTNNNTSGR